MSEATQPQAERQTLQDIRKKFDIYYKLQELYNQQYLSNEDFMRIPQHFPTNDEELTGFIQQLFHYGLKQHLPGCPVRVNSNKLSVRLDGQQHRQAQEIRRTLERTPVREYIRDKNRDLYNQIEQHLGESMRTTGRIEHATEEGREFFRIPFDTRMQDYIQGVYSGIAKQGIGDKLLVDNQTTIETLVAQRNEERKAEFIQTRTAANAAYIQAIFNKLVVPFEDLEKLRNGNALVAELRAAGLDVFVKEPTLRELASNEVLVDVFSGLDETQDEGWYIKPVTPEVIESRSNEWLYQGQGNITAYDEDPTTSKNGAIPFIVQHCVHAAARIEDFLSVLPQDFQDKLATSKEVYERVMGRDSTGLDVAGLRTAQPFEEEVAVEEVATESLAQGRTGEQAAGDVVDALTDSLLAQIRGASPEPVAEPVEEGVDDHDLPFEPEPVAETQPAETDALTESLLAQMRPPTTPEPQAQEQAQAMIEAVADPFGMDVVIPTQHVVYGRTEPDIDVDFPHHQAEAEAEEIPAAEGSYHEVYGENPIFFYGEGENKRFVAFRGQEGREFDNFNAAAIYANKQRGTVVTFQFEKRYNPDLENDVVVPEEFSGLLF